MAFPVYEPSERSEASTPETHASYSFGTPNSERPGSQGCGGPRGRGLAWKSPGPRRNQHTILSHQRSHDPQNPGARMPSAPRSAAMAFGREDKSMLPTALCGQRERKRGLPRGVYVMMGDNWRDQEITFPAAVHLKQAIPGPGKTATLSHWLLKGARQPSWRDTMRLLECSFLSVKGRGGWPLVPQSQP